MDKQQILKKLTSRKLWLTIAAFLASISTSITGVATDNTVIAGIGIGCAIISAAIYAAAEAYVDASAQFANATYINKNITASSTDKALVKSQMEEV